MQRDSVSLDDKYTLSCGRVFLSGAQAIARIAISQARIDQANGLNTAGFISGYRGSPLGSVDFAFKRAKQYLDPHDIRFLPGVNEELAATSVWGTQQVTTLPGPKKDGVFSMWYGKGPGVDRAGDALKHGNMAGTSKHGGVLVLAGDDHAAKSSTTAHQSEQALMASMIPILSPAGLQDVYDFGLFGFALSRFSGLWTGFKCSTEVIESSGTLFVDDGARFAVPELELPAGGLNINMRFSPLADEERVIQHALPAAQAFARANRFDHATILGDQKSLGIIASGKAYADTRKALVQIGLSEDQCRSLGINLYKIGLVWPLETEGIREFSNGHEELIVIEEKRAFIEDQVRAALYNLDNTARPTIVGKSDPQSRPLLPSHGELTPAKIASAIVARTTALGIESGEIKRWQERQRTMDNRTHATPPTLLRTPAFCSGCPHNRSTKTPDGSLSMAGIGCHSMAIFMNDRPTIPPTQMGGEGANWIGISEYSRTDHVFQNLGDGTYFHSGLLAIRAAVAAEVNITYKILYNDAVAMTGGQDVDGQLTVPDIIRQVLAESVQRVVLVSDDPNKDYGRPLPPRVPRFSRTDLLSVEEDLRTVPGVTVLIYDQVCAAEKRRRTKRGELPVADKRYFINEAVCEGCGDCSLQSNCVSIVPVETTFGRKRKIDQSSCNTDYSCVEGFCPSFITVKGGQIRKRLNETTTETMSALDSALPAPPVRDLNTSHQTIIAGIGGTGVVTIGALLGMASHLDGLSSSILDITGLSQKNGAVYSHVTIAPSDEQLTSSRIAAGEADLLLGCDLIVAGAPECLTTLSQGKTQAIVNTMLTPTASFQTQRDMSFELEAFTTAIVDTLGKDAVSTINASQIATTLMGDKIAANAFLLGYAYQSGFLPVTGSAIETAIELNGVAVAFNKQAFKLGRIMRHTPDALTQQFSDHAALRPQSTSSLIASRIEHLTAYQNAAYAEQYSRFVESIAAKEAEACPGHDTITRAVATNLAKLMSYKDEYEVARLHCLPSMKAKLEAEFDGDYTLRYNLAPPIFASRDPKTGHLRKREFGSWVGHLFSFLSRLKFLRGTSFDLFGYTAERRTERSLILEYREAVTIAIERLSPESHASIRSLAELPDQIRGFGHVKDASVVKARNAMAEWLTEFDAACQKFPAVQTSSKHYKYGAINETL